MMQISSVSNSIYTTNKNQRVQQGNGEYLHKAVRYSGADKIIEFNDKDSGRKIQFYSDDSIEKSFQRKFGSDYKDNGDIVKASGEFENYLQKMWSFNVKENNTVDNNNDGYIDINEFSDAKRVKNIDFNQNTKELSVNLSSFRDSYATEEKALEAVEKYFDERNISGNKISVDENFTALLYVDDNLDANIEDMEILADMHPQKLMEYKGLSIGEKKELFSMIDEWKKKRDEENGITDDSNNNIKNLKSHFSFSDKFLGDNNEKNIQNEKFSQDKVMKIKETLTILDKYVNTQADNAKIFSLKV